MYPKFNGKKLDELNRRRFDYWQHKFFWAIKNAKKHIPEDDMQVLAHNCACEVVWDLPGEDDSENTEVIDV